MEERLQKYLSECGVASRRGAEKLIKEGLISVNGSLVYDMGIKINPERDIVKYLDKIIRKNEEKVYLMLNKPPGYITTVKEQFGRPKVVDLLKGVKEKVYPVGRLDYESSGLLLLTNDGDLTYKLTHPGHEIDKTYFVKVSGFPDDASLTRLRKGIVIDGFITSPAQIDVIGSEKGITSLKFIIHEGRNRQIRKMCSAIGYRVVFLQRIAVGNITLGNLAEGKWRYLNNQEIHYLKGL